MPRIQLVLAASISAIASCAIMPTSISSTNILESKGVTQVLPNSGTRTVLQNGKMARQRLVSKPSKYKYKGLNGFRHIREYSDTELTRHRQDQLSIIVESDDLKESVAETLRGLGYGTRIGYADQVVVGLPEKGVSQLRKHFEIISDIPGVLVVTPRLPVKAPDIIYSNAGQRRLNYTPDDPYYATAAPTPQWALPAINADDAWDKSALRGVAYKMAIIDTGFNSHADLDWNASVQNCTGTVSFPTYAPSCRSSPGQSPEHGTMVAGVAGAHTNNSTGIAGASFWSNMYTYVAAEDDIWGDPYFYPDNVRAAAVHAINTNTVKIINLSTGWNYEDAHLESMVAYAELMGVLLVSTTGNDNASSIYYPAKYSLEYSNVIAVGGSNSSNGRWSDSGSQGSNYGSGITIVAPAKDIAATNHSGGYSHVTGTSYAAPLVSGALSSVWADCDNVDPKTLIHAVTRAAGDTVEGQPGVWDDEVGYGLFDFNGTHNKLTSSGYIYEWRPETGLNQFQWGYFKDPESHYSNKDFNRLAFRFGTSSGTNLASQKIIWNTSTDDVKFVQTGSSNPSGYFTIESNAGYVATVSGADNMSTPLYSYTKTESGIVIGHRYVTDIQQTDMENAGWTYEGLYGYVKAMD